MKKLSFFLLAFLLTTQLMAQQSWQWGKRGGGGQNENSIGSVGEGVVDMATDPNGNIYTLSNVLFHQNDVDVDGHALTGYNSSTDMVVSSFSCNGTYRWTKVIGSTLSDRATALRLDTLGGVYITGIANGINAGDSTFIGSDTVLPHSYRTMFIVKYDTAGNYKWVRLPQPDTTTLWVLSQGTYTYDMEVDKAGNSYSMCHLSEGLYGTGPNAYSVTTPGVHMLRYDRNGTFLGGNAMAITVPTYNSPIYKWWITRTNSGKFIVNGQPSYSGTALMFGNTPISSPGFVASFNSNGTLNWVKQSALSYAAGGSNTRFTKASLDAQSNIYLPGNGAPGDSFGGVAFANPIGYAPGVSTPNVFKLDSNGTTIWGKYAYSSGGSDGYAGTLTTNGEYVLGGAWSGNMYWPGYAADSIRHPSGWYQSIFLARFNAQTGAFIKMDTLYSPPGDNQEVTAMAADKKGNFFIGGSFQSEIKVAGATLTAKPGGSFDFFVTKYGQANCNCSNPPTASFTQSNINNTARSAVFQYTGTTANLDSLVWNWGNGQQLRLLSNFNAAVPYTFATGTFNVCVTAHTAGCVSTTCQTITFAPVGIERITATGSTVLTIVPNPATTSARIDYKLAQSTKAAALELFDLMGRSVASQQISDKAGSWTVNLATLPAGTYLVILRQNGGATLQTKLVVAH